MGVTRLGVPEDIANVAHFLLSNKSAYMTGECLGVVGKPLSRLWANTKYNEQKDFELKRSVCDLYKNVCN